MKIKAIEVNNLFSYDNFKIKFNEGNIAVIVGPNNAGKSNLFRVFEFLKKVIYDETKEIKSVKVINKKNKKTIAEDVQNYLYNRSERSAKIVVDIEFDDLEKNLLKDYFECFFKTNSNNANINCRFFKKTCDELGFNIEEKLVELFSKGKFIWEFKGEPSGRVVPYYKILMDILKDEKLKKELNKLAIFDSKVLKSNEEELKKFCSFIFDINNALEEDIKKFLTDNQRYLKDLNTIIHYLLEKFDKDIYFNIDEDRRKILYNSQNEPIFEVRDLRCWDTQAGGLYNFLKFLKEYPIRAKDTIFLILILIGLALLKNNCLSYDNILEHCERNLSDNILFEKAKNLFEYVDKQFNSNQNLLFHHFILKLFDKAIIKFEEVRGYPEEKYFDNILDELLNFLKDYTYQPSKRTAEQLKREFKSMYEIPTYEFENKNYEGNGKDLAKYLFYLKNAHEINIRNKYNEIRESFKVIFKSEKINFDVVNYNGYPEIYIIFEKEVKKDNWGNALIDYQLPIERVGSCIFEVLNILTVVIGAEHKVILLDEPALHLHPVYQKKLLNVLKGEVYLKEDDKISEDSKKLLENIKKRLKKNQIIIITHSPYFVDTKILENTFRFYKENGKTKAVNVYTELLREMLRKEIHQMTNGTSKILDNLSEFSIYEIKHLYSQVLKIKEIIEMYKSLNPNIIKNLEKSTGLSKNKIMSKFYSIEKISPEIEKCIDSFLRSLLFITEYGYPISLCYYSYVEEDINNKIHEIENVSKVLENNEMYKEFMKNEALIRSLFASGVILMEGYSEYISVPILLKKLGCILEDYNIEIINVLGDDNFRKIIKLMDSLKIDFIIICDNEAINDMPDEYKDKCFKGCTEDDWAIFLVNELKDCKALDDYGEITTFLNLLKEYNVNVDDIIISKKIQKKDKMTISLLVSRLIFEKTQNDKYKDVGDKIINLKQFIQNFINRCTSL